MTDWRNKILAYLHDPPHKAFNIAGHHKAREPLLKRLTLTLEQMRRWRRQPDHYAASADRLIFPISRRSRVGWKTEGHPFVHPLAGTVWRPTNPPDTAKIAGQPIDEALGRIVRGTGDGPNYLRIWRFWRDLVAGRQEGEVFAYIPADTRIPDHTIWQHNSVTSAFENCWGAQGISCAFLLFQIGPVQEFISQARKTQDLWAGSYLLSYLIAQGILAIASGGTLDGANVDGLGPDAIVYPNLRGLPLADWHWRNEGLFDDLNVQNGQGTLDPDRLLISHFPNRFLALVPAGQGAEQLARLAEAKIVAAWEEIAREVHDFMDGHLKGQFPGWDDRWPDQVRTFPRIDYVIHDWGTAESAIQAAGRHFPPLPLGWLNHPVFHAERCAKRMIKEVDRENFCYEAASLGQPEPRIRFAGFSWPLHYATADWLLAAAKRVRQFPQWSGAKRDKDALDGKNEIMGPSDDVIHLKAFWEHLHNHPVLGNKTKDNEARRYFAGEQRYGAVTIIKRIWADAYLFPHLGMKTSCGPKFKSVVEIASGKPVPMWDEDDPEEVPLEPEDSYYAVLFCDGDQLGQWIRGLRAPLLASQVRGRAKVYLESNWRQTEVGGWSFKNVRRALSPSYHAAISEALSNYGLYCVQRIVEFFGGQLIYCGGDDTLAFLPAAKALPCAETLYWAFRGQRPAPSSQGGLPSLCLRALDELFKFPVHEGGFIELHRPERGAPNWPLLVMGPRATLSAGVAIGHVHSPMQDTIQAAREARKRAKEHYGRDAFCLKLIKRSGDDVEVGGHWRATDLEHAALTSMDRNATEDPGVVGPAFLAERTRVEEMAYRVITPHPRLRLIEHLVALLKSEESGLSGRFPYRLGDLLRPQGLDTPWATIAAAAKEETAYTLSRQGRDLKARNPEGFIAVEELLCEFQSSLLPSATLSDYLAPFAASAWIASHCRMEKKETLGS